MIPPGVCVHQPLPHLDSDMMSDLTFKGGGQADVSRTYPFLLFDDCREPCERSRSGMRYERRSGEDAAPGGS